MTDTMIRALAFGTAMVLSGWAAAHDIKGSHGGRVADTARHHLELVVKNDTVEVFVSDKAHQPVPATGSTGFAIVVTAAGTTRIPLLASDGIKLTGKTTATLPDGTKGVVQVKLADGQTIQASFD